MLFDLCRKQFGPWFKIYKNKTTKNGCPIRNPCKCRSGHFYSVLRPYGTIDFLFTLEVEYSIEFYAFCKMEEGKSVSSGSDMEFLHRSEKFNSYYHLKVKDKHCRKLHCCKGVVDDLGLYFVNRQMPGIRQWTYKTVKPLISPKSPLNLWIEINL